MAYCSSNQFNSAFVLVLFGAVLLLSSLDVQPARVADVRWTRSDDGRRPAAVSVHAGDRRRAGGTSEVPRAEDARLRASLPANRPAVGTCESLECAARLGVSEPSWVDLTFQPRIDWRGGGVRGDCVAGELEYIMPKYCSPRAKRAGGWPSEARLREADVHASGLPQAGLGELAALLGGKSAARDGRLGDGAVLQHAAVPRGERVAQGAPLGLARVLPARDQAPLEQRQAEEAAQAARRGGQRDADDVCARDDDAAGRGRGGNWLGRRCAPQLGTSLPGDGRLPHGPAPLDGTPRGLRGGAGPGGALPGDGRAALQIVRPARLCHRRVGAARQEQRQALLVPADGGLQRQHTQPRAGLGVLPPRGRRWHFGNCTHRPNGWNYDTCCDCTHFCFSPAMWGAHLHSLLAVLRRTAVAEKPAETVRERVARGAA
ncbi:hypothetical protein EMIHUDRAFT_439876 [Emiliania huxleyi CCMP1516]|uniref:Uncharacterized protein n=2 Tax=Emiliania huxleyi TaxID=2903 RepID=A0A0D3KUF3_EMIH1|nr:hypothetical protein EMIHUDRAFT_439876 [Emiliania huxleyi CCMP1516]EOD39388.1 hypothetical protein EMIHUDRAFT_439876 [Emiliania huxleyi CCMP1516]|eukprot:XP_005791817.1 hypothetical protein EMIHUDRAFT_439876 [Emiliania huxleyi CCMP1516]